MEGVGSKQVINTSLAMVAGVYMPQVRYRLPRWTFSCPAYGLYCIFTELVVVSHGASFGLNVLLSRLELTERCVSTFATMNCIQISALSLYLYYRHADLGALADSLSDAQPSATLSWTGTVQKLLFLCETLPGSVWCFFPLFEFARRYHGGKRYLAGIGLYPFDPFVSPRFEMMVVAQACGTFIISMKMISFYDTLLSIGSRMVAKYITLRTTLSSAIDSPDPEASLKLWIKQHQETIRLGESLQKIYSVGLLIHLFFQLLVICTAVFIFVKDEMDRAQEMASAAYVLTNALKVFLICRLGDHISSESDRLSEELFGSKWYTCSGEVKNSLKIILARTNKNTEISAIGVFPLSSVTFRSFIASAYSYYTFLDEMNH